MEALCIPEISQWFSLEIYFPYSGLAIDTLEY